MVIDLSKQTALVCGSTQGIGRAVAEMMAAAGARVVLLARNEEKLKEVVAQLPCRHNQIHSYLQADFNKPEQLKNKLAEFIKQVGSISILVNNTGGPKAGPASTASVEEFEIAFSNHLVCNQVLMQECLEGMKNQKMGRIINIISTSVKQPLKGLGVSNTIRAAVANWAKTLSVELAPFGITVNNVLPGATSTQRLNEIIKNKAEKSANSRETIELEMLNEIPAGRFASPQEIAHAVVFLASAQAAYINGINLPVDGGRTACL